MSKLSQIFRFSDKKVKIVEKFPVLIAISLVFIIIGGIFMAVNKGLNIGIDFAGGTQIEIELGSFAADAKAKDIIVNEINDFFITKNGCKLADAVQSTTHTDGSVSYEFRLSYYHYGNLSGKEQEEEFISFIQGDLTDDTNNGICGEFEARLEELFAADETLKNLDASIEEGAVKAHVVGATASSALLRTAIIALIVAIIVMLIYIVIRFTFSSALAAICALIHDVLIMIALTAIFRVPVNATFIAAVITIIGYSINATIVVFDRIREERKKPSNEGVDVAEIANTSIMKTLNRSILTTVTTLVMVIVFAVFSVANIREFILPIIFGLIAGAYSSVFLASSFWVMFQRMFKKSKIKNSRKKVASK
ncbi:MAG: protein translocase subunit SecF [Christensenellaceae bacterium]